MGARSMNEETKQTQKSLEEARPRLSRMTQQNEDEPVDKVIRESLEELRLT